MTSTTSKPTKSMPRSARTMASASWAVRPPGSGVPVPGPVPGAVDRAAQDCIDRVGHTHEALLNGAAHPRAVVVLLAEVAVPGVGVGVEVDHRDRAARARGA